MKGCKRLTDTEIQAVLACLATPRDKLLFVFGLRTGLRITELLSLRIEDVLSFGNISDSVYVQKRFTKGKAEGRCLPLHKDVKTALRAYLDVIGDFTASDYLFKSAKGDNRAIGRIQAWTILDRAFKSAQVSGPTGTHSMRKTFAGKLYEAFGKDLAKTQLALGHINIMNTVDYLAVDEDEVNAMILKVS